MSFRFQKVKHFKRGAKFSDGETRTCITCRIEKRLENASRYRAVAATYTAEVKNGSPFVLPVAYCDNHVPEEIKK